MDSSRYLGGSRGVTLVGLEVFLVRALVVGWWRAMHSSAALMSECVGSWGPARASLLWSRVRGATGGASPPSPSAARRPDARCISTHGYHRPCTTSTRRTPWTWPKRPTRGREVFWLCWFVCSDTHNPRASVRVRRASPHAGEARAAPQPSRSRRERAVRRHACACVERIFGTKAEPQRIVATRPLCRVQHPVPHSSRLQGIHRVGPVTCDRVRLRPKLSVLAAERPTR